MDKSEPEIEPTGFLRADMVDGSIRGAFEEFHKLDRRKIRPRARVLRCDCCLDMALCTTGKAATESLRWIIPDPSFCTGILSQNEDYLRREQIRQRCRILTVFHCGKARAEAKAKYEQRARV